MIQLPNWLIIFGKTVHDMNDPVIVTDNEENVIYANRKAVVLFPCRKIQMGISVSLQEFAESISACTSPEHRPVVKVICAGEAFDDPSVHIKLLSGEVYTIRKISVQDGDAAHHSGHVLHMTDITEKYTLLDKVKTGDEALEDAYRRLGILNEVREHLVVEKERTRLRQHLHDTMGHNLVTIMTLIRVAVLEPDNRQPLRDALALAGKLLEGVRDFVRESDEAEESVSIVYRLRSLIDRMNVTPISVELSVLGEEKESHIFAAEAIFNVVLEAVTNSIRHGQADHIDVVIKFSSNLVQLLVADNGRGCAEIHRDMGLKGMEKAVQYIGGRIQFRSGAGEGFVVRVSIPIRELDILEITHEALLLNRRLKN